MKDVVFVTTTLYTKWLDYQKKIISDMFPESEHIIIDGTKNWPQSWFYWIDEVKKSDKKYYVHIDEDFFITSKSEFIKMIDKMKDCDLLGVPDGFHHYRGANPIALNTFLMVGKVEHLRQINLANIQFAYTSKGWINSYNLVFKEEYKIDYPFTIQGGANYDFLQEPYYAFMWVMKELGIKFDYLFPYFDERYKSTNPRLAEDSEDIGIHLWYTRNWDSDMDVWGVPNYTRYELIEKYIHEIYGK